MGVGGTYLLQGALKEGRHAKSHLVDGFPLPPSFALVRTAQKSVSGARGQDTHPPTYLQPWAETQTPTCGGWQVGGHSVSGCPQS